MPLMGRSAILGEQRNNYFCDVACGRGDMGDSTYAITKTGLLCEFNNRRLLDKWVELRTTSANCMAIGETFIFIGCADGIVRCFSQSTLQFITTLPRTHYLGVNVAEGTTISHMAAPPSSAKYPDTIALTYDEQNCKLTCVYNDHSLYVWDVRDIKRVGKAFSFLFHSACIWGVDMYPVLEDSPHLKSAMPPGSFITCSSDDTIRVWNLDTTSSSESKMYRSNIYSKDLLRIIYIDPEHSYLQDLDLCVTGNTEKNDTSYDGRNGVRSVCISPDGQHMASGDRSGNIRIHSLHSLEEICLIEAHDAEVLSLEYSRPESGHRLLASASRDRLIHVFNVDEDYNFNQTLDDHSSSITAVRFLYSGNQMHMVSCGADKSIIFRQLQTTPGGSQIQFSRGHNIAGKTTLYDMEVDSSHKHVLTACQDRNIRVYNINTGKHSKTFKGSVGDEGSLIKVVLDNSGIYAATSCTDKTLCIYDYYSGECMATMFGHSELVTGLRFTNDCRRLISASGDGCIFIWKVPHDMVITMHARLSQQATRAGKKLYVSDGLENEELSHSSPDHSDPNYRFSIGQLPFWAKKQIADHAHAPSNLNNRQMDLPKGRWAQRLDTRHITVKSVYETDGVITLPLDQDKKVDSDGSKDSSIDSGTELRDMLRDVRRDNMYMGKTDVESTEHDGDVEDYSEGEGESTEPEQIQRVMYYPPAEETGSDYTVNAMDVEELRRSQRRNKKNQRPERLQDLPLNSLPTSISGSQESDDDEDASTPSAETTERNLMSMLSASSESLDVMSQREKYLKSTFESMSGPETDGGRANNKESGGKSISSQYLGRANHLTNNMYGTPRNVEVIKAAKQIRCATETTRKREELQRRIDETRRKLQSVGHSPHLKSSQSISDLSHIPGKDSRDSRVTNLAHRYTAAGGKEYAAIIRNKMNASLPLSTIINVNKFSSIKYPTYSSSGVEKLLYLSSAHSPPTQNLPKLLSLTSHFQKHINEKISSEKYALQTSQNFNNINLYPDSLTSTSINIPETVETQNSNNQLKNMDIIYKSFPLSKSYNVFPSTSIFSDSKYTPSSQKLSAINRIPMSCSASSYSVGDVLSKNLLGISPSLKLSNCINTENASVDIKSADTLHTENVSPNNNVSNPNTSTNYDGLPISNLIATKNAWNASNSGGVKPTNKRPIQLNIKSNSSYSKDFQKKNHSGPPLINQSLPESPVYEKGSLAALFGHCLTDTETSASSSKYGQKRRSCSYFIDLNMLSDKVDESEAKRSKNIVKSSESLPARMSELHASSEENLLDSCNEDNEDDPAENFSSDSLEEPSEFSTRTPRRCTSDYQIFKQPKELSEFDFGPRSASAAERRYEQKKKVFCSQESILSDNSGCTSSLNSGEILDIGTSYEQDRHSSASFFLSLKRNNTLSCRSQESILTDESEYQVLADSNVSKCDGEKRRDSCRSEGSILESDLNSSLQLENINEFSCPTHQDLYHSTESILTDDSDCQIFSTSPRVKTDSNNSTLEESKFNITIYDGDKKKYNTRSQIKSISEVEDCTEDDKIPKCAIQKCNSLKVNRKDNHQTIFRTKSLQDTTTDVLSFNCSNQNKDEKQNTLSVYLDNTDRLSENSHNDTNLVRNKSFPSSRPLTPNSLQTSPLRKSHSTFFPDSQNDLHNKSDDIVRSGNNKQKPPTAPKPTAGKVIHKPPVKPRQKMLLSQPLKQKLLYNKDITKDLLSRNSPGYGSKLRLKSDALQTLPDKHHIELLTDNKVGNKNIDKTINMNKSKSTTNLKSSSSNKEIISGIGVKLLCKNFENVTDHDMSDECIADLEEDSYPAIGGSGSSTPATSSSTATSPKRLWPPASRAPVHRLSSKKSTSSRQSAPTNKCAPADSDDGGESQSQNLRRSCSLSDLTNPSPQRHTTPQQVSGKATTPSIKTPSKSSNTRALPRHSAKPGSGSQTNIIRSTSMVVLNQQSDSESDVNHSQRPAVPSRMGNLMRHTISSQNKLNQNSTGKSSGVSARRRILSAAYSSVNLSNVGNDDSSSEETSPVGGKPANSVRPRSTSVDRGNSSGHVFLQPQPPPRHGRELSRTAREVTQRLTGGRSRPTPASRHLQVDPSPHEWPVKDTDVKSTPLSLQLCTSVADQLTRTADSVVQLHKRLASECDPSTRRDMLSALEEAISETQKTLQCVTTPGEEGPSTVDPEMSAKLQELVASSNQGDQTSVLNVVQQCSNILYAMVQKKMSNSVLPQDQ